MKLEMNLRMVLHIKSVFLLFLISTIYFTVASNSTYGEIDRTLTYYRSNSFGMKIQPISWFRADDFKYVLAVRNERDTITERLLEDGRELEKWEKRLDSSGKISSVRHYKKNIVIDEKDYLHDGRISEERRFRDGKLNIRVVYRYSGSILNEKQYFDSEGKLVYTDFFSLNKDGSLRAVTRESGGKAIAGSVYFQSVKGLSDDIQYNEDTMVIAHYDTWGRLVKKDRRKNGRIIKSEVFYYKRIKKDESEEENGRAEWELASKQIQDYETGTRENRIYDDKGRLLSRVLFKGEKEILSERITWNKNLMSRRIVRTEEEGIEEYKYFYDSSENLIQIKYFHRGFLEKSTEYGKNNERIETLYRKGKVFMKVYYHGEERYKEEVIVRGKVIRTRNLKPSTDLNGVRKSE